MLIYRGEFVCCEFIVHTAFEEIQVEAVTVGEGAVVENVVNDRSCCRVVNSEGGVAENAVDFVGRVGSEDADFGGRR